MRELLELFIQYVNPTVKQVFLIKAGFRLMLQGPAGPQTACPVVRRRAFPPAASFRHGFNSLRQTGRCSRLVSVST